MEYTHVVIDESLHNFKVGTEVFILQEIPECPEWSVIAISDGKFVKMCLRSQLKSKEDFK